MAETTLVLPARTPVAAQPLRRFVAAHVVPGADRYDPASGEHVRCVPTAGGPVVTTTALGTGAALEEVRVRVPAATPPAGAAEVAARVARWLDLDADTAAVETALADDPRLGPLVAARPGLRVPRAVSGAEQALLTVVGQQVSLAAACTFASRLVAAFGVPAADGLTAFPDPAALAAAGPDALRAASGLTGARSRTLHGLAVALADGLDLDAPHDPDARAATRARLLALPGVGPWTADYVAVRALGADDGFLASDLVLRRALGGVPAREAEARSQAWRPWRSYALLHLWTAEVFA